MTVISRNCYRDLLCLPFVEQELSLSNLGLGDSFAAEMGRILASNTSIEVLNLETNNITAEGVVSLVEGCSTNTTLKELRLENQRHQTGIGGAHHCVGHGPCGCLPTWRGWGGGGERDVRRSDMI